MAYPPAYNRTFSFTDYEVNFPGEPKPGDELDNEYDNVSNALTATQANLALIQRADGELANDSVGADQLEDGIFDGIADGITADAEAAADAAAASAAAAASSATAAAGSAANAFTSENNAAGSAAQAGVSQSIAQGAATQAEGFRNDADDAAVAASNAANEAQGFRNEASLHEALAFDWAEKLEGPVMPAPPGWPEAVDDGMFSSKWWAIRAREYNTVTHIDLGTAGADIGEAFDIWDAIPGNDLPLGQVFASWGSPPLEYALTDPSNPSDPDSWTLISGGPGPPGPANTLTIGTVATGTPTSATITGTAPNQVLNLVIEPGPTGATGAPGPAGADGPAGPPNTLNVGTTTTGAPGSSVVVTITGASPAQTINFTIPRGDVGPPGPSNFANPTGTIGLTAVNGVATTALRSDAAPALSQAIAPTWTGSHTFNIAPFITGTGPANFPAGLELAYVAASGYSRLTSAHASNFAPIFFNGSALLAPNGTASLPSYSFEADRDTGIYWDGANNFSLTAGGVQALWVSTNGNVISTGRFFLQDGGGGNPSLSFMGDQDTGLYRRASNNISFSAGGTLVVDLSASSFNTYVPLWIPDGTNAAPSYTFDLDRDTGFYRSSSNGIGFAAGGFTAATLNRGAFQLYGTASDASNLAYVNFLNSASVQVGYIGDVLGGDSNITLAATVSGANLVFNTNGGIAVFNQAVQGVSFTSTSSRAIKRETGAPTRARDILARLRPVLYRLLAGDDREQLGLIAEEVHEVCPQLSDGKTVAYDRLALLLLADWQESHAEA